MAKRTHHPGPGLKILSKTRWYGGGYCAICGTRGDELVPQQVRYWDPDDGWRVGVLCAYCGDEATSRGPRPGDYANHDDDNHSRIDVLASFGDEDSTYTSGNE